MRVIIAGSRTLRDPQIIEIAMKEAEKLGIIPTFILSGGQKTWDSKEKKYHGADYFGERWAKARHIPVRQYLANWARFGHAAGPTRNGHMVSEADALVAVWDGKSSGTSNVIGLAHTDGLLVHIHTFST